jgi:hypothetical protein
VDDRTDGVAAGTAVVGAGPTSLRKALIGCAGIALVVGAGVLYLVVVGRIGTRVTIKNETVPPVPLTDVGVAVRGDRARIGVVSPGEARSVHLHPHGESGVVLDFTIDGHPTTTGERFYVDSDDYAADSTSVVVAMSSPARASRTSARAARFRSSGSERRRRTRGAVEPFARSRSLSALLATPAPVRSRVTSALVTSDGHDCDTEETRRIIEPDHGSRRARHDTC